MTCREFERLWNELLDAETGEGRARSSTGVPVANPAERERALLEHASECVRCGRISARYQVLRRAIRAWGPPPAPSAGLADRIVAVIESPPKTAWPVYGLCRRERPSRVMVGLAAAFAAAAVLGFGLNWSMQRSQPRGPQVILHNTPSDPKGGTSFYTNDPRSLNSALADATAATWDLARSASEPAARISREVLDAASGTDTTPFEGTAITSAGAGPVTATALVPSLDTLIPDASAGAMLQQVSDHFADGVRPLSDTARHAFGFLLGPTLTKPEVRLNSPAQKGA